MPFTIRRIDPDRNFVDHISWDIFAATIPVAAVDAALTATGAHEQRHRRLSMRVIVFLVIAMNIWTQCAIPMVFRHMVRGLRWIWPTDERLPQSNALTYRRYQLGVKPLAWLFHQQCQPLATDMTLSAFLFGLRLMAIDGTVENVADTPENAAYFGRPGSRRGPGAFPQAQLVYLIECGTHAIVDAGIWPCTTPERIGSRRMLRSVGPGMLVMWDRGLHSYRMLAAALARGAHVLTRLSTATNPVVRETLADGTQLVAIEPHHAERGKGQPPLVLRRIAYQLSMPALGDPTAIHYLLTTLLDPTEAPARALVCAYHERWEVEIAIDELDTHQRITYRPFRSQKPVGVIQEFYGSLLAHYAIRAVMHDAAVAVTVDPDRISFVVAVEEIRAAVREFQQTDPGDHPALYQRLLAECTRTLLPRRRLRIYPRVIKQKMSRFFRKRPEDQGWCDPTAQFATAVCVVGADGAACPRQAALPPIQWTQTP
jgi:hypothetical protein